MGGLVDWVGRLGWLGCEVGWVKRLCWLGCMVGLFWSLSLVVGVSVRVGWLG